jgi:hypothetical protein
MYTRPYMVIAIPAGLSLIGFIFATFGDSYDLVSMFIIFQFFAVVSAPYLAIANLMYTAYLTGMPTKIEKLTNWHTGASVEETPAPAPATDGFIPMVRKAVPTIPVYNQTVSLPRFDKERSFAVTLIRMYEYDPDKDADMTQAKWVKTGRFIRAEFVAMLENWKDHGVIVRASEKKNAPYRVDRWDAVRLIANGNPLAPR